MTCRGKVQGGVVVMEDGALLPEGTRVLIEPAPVEPAPLAQMLLKHAGKAKGLPRDAARNHDHYLYGTPKR